MNLYKELLKLEFAGLINITPGGNLPTVANYAALPDATLHSGDKYLVLNGSGVWLINRKPAGIYYSDGSTWTFVDEYVDIITGAVQAGDSKLFDGASLSTDNTLGGDNPSDTKVPSEKAISEKMATIITGMPIGTVFFWPFREEDLPDCALAGKGQTLIRADYASLWGMAQHVTGTGRQQYGVGNGSTTFTLPDLRGEFLRGAYYGDISASAWDVTTNDDVDLGRSDIPMGTPVVFSVAPCTGITAGTIYYLALRTGTKYCLYDTEAHANANGATGKVSLSGTPVDSSYTTAGLPQGSAMWGHCHEIYDGVGNYAKSVTTGGNISYGNIYPTNGSDTDRMKAREEIDDETHGTPSASDESRSRNTQGIWCIQVTNGEIAAEDRTNIEQRLSDLENAYINNKYETGWINRSDWTNVHLGSSTTKNTDSNVTHNLGKHLKDLHVRVLISPTGSDADCWEVKEPVYRDNSSSVNGMTVYEVDDDNIKIQTGASGLLWIQDDGTPAGLDSDDYYYKIIVVAHNAYTFVDARSDGNRCRAWVNFNGTGTVAIRASENVDGITDNGTGDYTINLTSGAVEDENYAAVITTGGTSGAYNAMTNEDVTARTTSAVRILCTDTSFNANDPAQVSASIFR